MAARYIPFDNERSDKGYSVFPKFFVGWKWKKLMSGTTSLVDAQYSCMQILLRISRHKPVKVKKGMVIVGVVA